MPKKKPKKRPTRGTKHRGATPGPTSLKTVERGTAQAFNRERKNSPFGEASLKARQSVGYSLDLNKELFRKQRPPKPKSGVQPTPGSALGGYSAITQGPTTSKQVAGGKVAKPVTKKKPKKKVEKKRTAGHRK